MTAHDEPKFSGGVPRGSETTSRPAPAFLNRTLMASYPAFPGGGTPHCPLAVVLPHHPIL